MHDTLATGTGNDNYSFTVPQFNPSTGTLVAVVIKTNVSIGYSFEAENTTNSSRSVSIGVGRYDYLSSPALSNSNYASGTQKTYGPYTLGKSDGVPNSGTDYLAKGPFSFLSNTVIINDSIISSVASFLGTGTVNFGYY
ncbi:MAG: choice-of-anchor E domain-containing protein, partial [Bacteroidetes bacterium]|nr:choice-of-anchor E domain-containing protein [Bacteroidota bacterium]